ncbi:MAG: preprotein translocase subunit SecY [Ignavibacteria bacterium]|nr:preprotein translocase subunit SecY [Ignavibacteria bacterium]
MATQLRESFRNIFKIEELRIRILYTLFILFIVRVGAHITLPGIDTTILEKAVAQSRSSNTLFGLYDLFVGGAFSNAAIFALGIMPYISSSIVIQLLGAVFPYFQKLSKEGGEEGRNKLNQYTRYGTVLISLMQGWGVSQYLLSLHSDGQTIIADGTSEFVFVVSTVIVLTASTIFIMWLGERVTERGIGNGISLIIFVGIIAQFPISLWEEFQLVATGNRGLIVEMIILVLMFFIIAGVVMVTQGTRRIPVQYAKRVVGKRMYGGVTQYIPMKVIAAGVMPIIFAQAIMFIPSTVFTFFPDSDSAFMQTLQSHFSYTSFTYSFIYAVLIVFFTYFYTAVIFNPKDVADNMQKQGGFIPGIRPGKHTSDFIDGVLTKITLPGSIFLAIIAILPAFMVRFGVSSNFASFFGGTSLLIIVGVALDTLQQIESHLLMRHYDGFMKGGKIRGRRG